jgi:hypothetical protein
MSLILAPLFIVYATLGQSHKLLNFGIPTWEIAIVLTTLFFV